MSRCCCGRGRPSRVAGGPPVCKALEESGSSFLVWPIRTGSGLHLAVKLPVGKQIKQVDLFSFLTSVNCNGPTATWLKREISFIQNAVQKKEELFYGYTSSGISVNKLVQISRRATRDQEKLPTNSSR